ncbi:hypothetical protein NDU88_001630 [Pleurodeles waltl]|uniref:Uncharacterized protein n=1 Tax=Pleurodeles waltl TaxID=8319 RepID=A0AAV7RC53_PLEWA|nr:hypothetical protein NDU88_001630 [Pleurodeles waltl]
MQQARTPRGRFGVCLASRLGAGARGLQGKPVSSTEALPRGALCGRGTLRRDLAADTHLPQPREAARKPPVPHTAACVVRSPTHYTGPGCLHPAYNCTEEKVRWWRNRAAGRLQLPEDAGVEWGAGVSRAAGAARRDAAVGRDLGRDTLPSDWCQCWEERAREICGHLDRPRVVPLPPPWRGDCPRPGKTSF